MESRRVGPFLLGEELGAGGMGVVFRATYHQTGQQVALKLLPAEMMENERAKSRFQRELRILTKLRHPNVVRCFGGGTYGTRLFYAMELVEGGTLSALLKQRGRLSWETTVDFGRQVAAALEHAHQAGVIHRDLKPANLLLTGDGKLKLSDFGLARDQGATALTVAGRALGTFAYMAPEVIRGEPPVSHRSDLYSLGCVLFEMLTGQTPFRASSPAEMFYQHLDASPPRVSTLALDCPIWLEALVAQLLEKDPSKRPFDATAVRRGLAEIEERVLSQASMTGHSLAGGPSVLSIERDVRAVRKLVANRQPKPRRVGPVYEQAWFLALCLAVLVGLITWVVWPASEERLFADAQALLAAGEGADLQRLRREYLEPLLTRFPQGRHAEWAQQQLDEHDMHLAEERLRNRLRLGKPLGSEGERLYADAARYEQFGDRVTALEKYRDLTRVLTDQVEHRAYLNLARRQIAAIEQGPPTTADRLQIVEAALAKAESQFHSGQVVDARQTWESIVNLYSTNREMEPLVERARNRLAGRTAHGSESAPPSPAAQGPPAEPPAEAPGDATSSSP